MLPELAVCFMLCSPYSTLRVQAGPEAGVEASQNSPGRESQRTRDGLRCAVQTGEDKQLPDTSSSQSRDNLATPVLKPEGKSEAAR